MVNDCDDNRRDFATAERDDGNVPRLRDEHFASGRNPPVIEDGVKGRVNHDLQDSMFHDLRCFLRFPANSRISKWFLRYPQSLWTTLWTSV